MDGQAEKELIKMKRELKNYFMARGSKTNYICR